MKLFRMLGRSIRDAFKSVIRNFSLSLASISCITITLIIVTVAIIATFNVQNFTKEIEKDMTIVVFLDTDEGVFAPSSFNFACAFSYCKSWSFL